MSDKPYEKECSFCKQKITMSKATGSWLPYELNSDKKHDCRKNNRQETFTLEAVLKKLQSVGITVNLMELMKE